MTDSELIKNHTLFFAYFCHLIEADQAREQKIVDGEYGRCKHRHLRFKR